MIPKAEKYEAQESHKLLTLDIQAVELNIAKGSWRIEVAGVYRSPDLMLAEGRGLLLFLSVVA